MDGITKVPISVIKKMIEVGKCKMTICGNSMEPTFYEGQCVHIESIKDKIQVNDIILMELNGHRIVHRVVATDDDYTLTKGDNNPYMDEIVPNKCILGKMVERYQEYFLEGQYSITYNFWRKEEYEKCKYIAQRLKLNIIQRENYIPKDKLNIVIHPYSLEKISNLNVKFPDKKDICIHIGVNLGNKEADSIVLDTNFDGVYSGGSLWSPHRLDVAENFLVLYGQVQAFVSDVEEIYE